MIIRLIVAIVIVYLLYRIGKLVFLPRQEKRSAFPGRRSEIGSEDLVKDPQCGVYVPVRSAVQATLRGETLYFCSEECRDAYLAHHAQ